LSRPLKRKGIRQNKTRAMLGKGSTPKAETRRQERALQISRDLGGGKKERN